jgi:hypothetical protein
MSTDAALERIRQVADTSPEAVLLARLASLATRIEPNLLRRLRTELLPEADVSAEADLWFSALIDSAGSDAIELDPRVADILRTDLARDAGLLENAARITHEAHVHLPPALRLEEQIIALGLSGDEDAGTRIDEALSAALRTLTGDPVRARETARWFARAWPRLPETVRRTRSAATLAIASGMITGRSRRGTPVDANATIDDVRWVFRDQTFTDFDTVDAFIEGDTIIFAEAGATGGMRVPRTEPRVVEVSFGTGDSNESLLVDASPGTAVSIPPDIDRITFTTLAGDVYELERASAAGESTEESTGAGPPWIAVSPYREFMAACVMVSAGETAYRVTRTGFRPTSGHVVTVREPLVLEELIVVEPAAFGSKPRPRPDVQSPLLVIESNGPNAMAFSTPPLVGASDEPGQSPVTTRPQNVVAIGYHDNELRAIAGSTVIDDPMTYEFHVIVESSAPLPDEFAGGPVIVDGRVCGIVTSIEPAEGEKDTWILTVASGLAIKQALDSATAAVTEEPETEQMVEQAQSGADSDANVAQKVSRENLAAAKGNRLAKILVVARDMKIAQEAVRTLAEDVVRSFQYPERKGVSWNVEVRGAPDLRAGVVFWVARSDPDWPLVLDLRNASLALLVESPDGPSTEDAEGDDAWEHSIRATIETFAPHVPVVSSSDMAERTGSAFPAGENARDALLQMIDWSAQPDLDKETWQSAPRLAFEPPASGPVGHARELFSQTGGWDAEIDQWLGILAGARVVESADIVFRDPDWFENIVIAMVRALRREQAQRAVPAIDLFSVERTLNADRLLDQSSLPVGTQSVVYAAATVLRNAGLAALINTDYGSVMVMPSLALDGSGAYRPAEGDRVMSADWTGDVRTGFFAVVAAFEWSDGRVEEVGWHSQITEGVARVERDGRYRMEAKQSGQIAELVVTEEAEAPSGDTDRALRTIRTALEEALADNRSLDIREERMLA